MSGDRAGQPLPALDADIDERRVELDHARTPVNVYGIALEWSVKIELTAALLEAARPDVEPRPGADLLANVLDGAATEAAG